MNNKINKFVLAGDKSMPEMYLRQPEFTYSVCGPIAKKQNKKTKIQGSRRLQIYLQE